MDYEVLYSDTPEKLSELVNVYVNERGYGVVGGVACCMNFKGHEIFCQAVYKEKPKKPYYKESALNYWISMQ